jgi:predicted permease
MLQDVVQGFRTLRRTPLLSAVTVLTLGLGIGANSAIFSIVNGALLKPLPYPAADRIVQISREFPEESWPTVSIPKFVYWQDHNQVFDSLAAYEYLPSGYTMTGDGQPERLLGLRATAEFFDVLGVSPSLGRDFLDAEDVPGGPRVIVLSDGLWKRRFGGDPSIVGRDLVLNDEAATVVGVMPAGFSFPADVELWTPYQFDRLSRDQNKARQAIGRIRSDLDLEDARAAMMLLGQQHRVADPALVAETEVLALTPLREQLHGSLRPALLVLLASVGFVLLIACVNVANLQLARSAARRRELALRAALGASRARIARQLLTESGLLALAGGGAGLLLGYWLLRLIMSLGPASLQGLPAVGVDATVIWFTLAISLGTGILVGVMPALHATRAEITGPLREGSPRTAGGGATLRTRRILVMAETALALVLVIGATLLMQSFIGLVRTDPGFSASEVLTMRLPLPTARYGDVGALDRLNRQLVERMAVVPGVDAMGLASTLPLDAAIDMPFAIEGRFRDDGTGEGVGDGQYRAVWGRYFGTLQIPLLRGRTFTEADGQGAVGVAIINETAARRYWPNADPIGRRITPGMPHVPELADREPRTIVGVVADVRELSLDAAPPVIVYVPLAQLPQRVAELMVGSLPEAIVVRTSVAPGEVSRSVRQAIRDVDPTLPVTDVMALDTLVSRSLGSARFNSMLLALFSAVALLLAAIGIYGILAHLVTARTREIGVRIALGASRRQVLGLVLGQASWTVGVGIVVGLAAAAVATRGLSSMLFGIEPTDPITYLGAALLVAAVAGAATLVPARRAASLDPTVAIRVE